LSHDDVPGLSDRPLRAGLYGPGAFGRFLLDTLRSGLPQHGATVVAVAGRNVERTRVIAAAYPDLAVRENWNALLADPAVDAVIVATPPATHAELVREAVAAGKHVFIEKPLAVALSDGRRVVDSARHAGRVVAVDYPMPYTPLVAVMHRLLTSRLAGRLLRIGVENIASCSGLGEEHWLWDPAQSGGLFVEHGVHFFDWCEELLGAPDVVVALACSARGREDRVVAALRHEDGSFSTYLHAFTVTPREERTRITLSFREVDVVLEGWIPTHLALQGPAAALVTTALRRMVDRSVRSVPDPRLGFIFDAGPKQEVYAAGVRGAFADFVRAVREPGYIPRNDARRALRSLALAEAAREAAQTGVAVRPQIPQAEENAAQP
jgi:predicted dehydrogenase